MVEPAGVEFRFKPTMDYTILLVRLKSLAHSALALLPGIAAGLLALGLFLLIATGVRSAVARTSRLRAVTPALALVLGRIASGLIAILGVLVGTAVAFPSINASDLFSVLGIGGVAIGFAFRDILQNLLAGILLLLTHPFRLGDQIKLGEFEGTVEDIQIRASVIRTYDNRRAVIPNSELFSGKVLVNTAYEKRRLMVGIGIGNGDNVADTKQIILDALRKARGVLDDPLPQVRVAALGDYAVQLNIFVWINPPRRDEVLEVIDEVLTHAKAALTQAGIDLPFPTQQILLHDQTEVVDGNRDTQREGWPTRPGQETPRPLWQVAATQRTKKVGQSAAPDQPQPSNE